MRMNKSSYSYRFSFLLVSCQNVSIALSDTAENTIFISLNFKIVTSSLLDVSPLLTQLKFILKRKPEMILELRRYIYESNKTIKSNVKCVL